jgi:peptide/nickel transport system substrate-binding protein
MSRRVCWLGVSLLLVVGLVLPSCGPAVPTAVPTAVPKKDVELRVGVSSFGEEKFDPMDPSGDMTLILAAMYDAPCELDAKGMVAPGVVKSWEIAPDGLSWTLRLRDDVFFHDGVNADGTVEPSRKVTAADVAFSYERAIAGAYRGSEWLPVLGDKPKTEVIDDYTARIYTAVKTSYLPISSCNDPMIWVVPKAYIQKNGLAYFNSHPIGSGAYKFVRYVSGDVIQLQAVDRKNWRTGGVPEFNKLTYYLIPDEATRTNMLKKGTVDTILVSLENALALKKEGFSTVRGLDTTSSIRIAGGHVPEAKGMPLGDVRVRQALSLAINRQELIDTIFQGQASLPTMVARIGLGSPDVSLALRAKWEPKVIEDNRYDPVAARKLIVDAGFGDKCTFDFWYFPDNAAPWLGGVMAAVAGYWQKVGCQVNTLPVDIAVYQANRSTRKSDKLIGKMVVAAGSAVNPSSIRQMTWYTTSGAMIMLHGSPLEAEMDALYAEGLSTVDPARMDAILDRMLTVMESSWTIIALVNTPRLYTLGPRVNPNVPPIFEKWGNRISEWKYTGVEVKQ